MGEADGYVDLPVTLSAPGQGTVTVKYATSDGTAYGEDEGCAGTTTAFVDEGGTLTFAPGVTTQVVRVPLLNCGFSPGLGFLSFYLKLSANSANSSIVRAVALVDVTGDKAASATPGLYVRDATVDASAGTVQVPVVLGGPSGAAQGVPVTVHYSTADGSAKAGTDYAAESGTLDVPAGRDGAEHHDPDPGPVGCCGGAELHGVVDSASNATVAYGTGTVTIGASGGSAAISPGIYAPPDVVVGEADGYVDLPVTLSAPGQGTVTVSFPTTDGTAYGEDEGCAGTTTAFVDEGGTLTFAPGVTTQVVRVPLA